MNLLRYLMVSVITLSSVGCCCSRCVVTDPCDPCGAMPVQSCSISRLWPFSRIHSCLSRACVPTTCACACGSCGSFDSYSDVSISPGCGCGAPMESCGAPMMTCGAPMGSCGAPVMTGIPSTGCNCTQGGSYSNSYPMSTPTYSSSPTPTSPTPLSTPAAIPEIPPSSAPLPPTGGEPSAFQAPHVSQQPQMVSYEEFQRLPGNIISGPGAPGTAPASPVQQVASSVPAMTVPPVSTPTAMRTARPQGTSANQQAVWASSAKPY